MLPGDGDSLASAQRPRTTTTRSSADGEAVPQPGRQEEGRQRGRALSDRLRARALVLALRPRLALEDAATTLEYQASGNRTALRHALRGLSRVEDTPRSPAVHWAASALRLAVAHADCSYEHRVPEPVLGRTSPLSAEKALPPRHTGVSRERRLIVESLDSDALALEKCASVLGRPPAERAGKRRNR